MEVLSLLFATTFLLLSVLLSLLLLAGIKYRNDAGEDRILVVVLGDVGRSPRMQYHCLSLVQQDYNVDLVGLRGVCVSAYVEQLCIVFCTEPGRDLKCT